MRFTFRNLSWLTVLLALGVAAEGCSLGSSKSRRARPAIVLSENEVEARARLLSEIPPGTNMEQARGQLGSLSQVVVNSTVALVGRSVPECPADACGASGHYSAELRQAWYAGPGPTR